MLFVPAFPLYVFAAVLAVTDRSPSVPGLVGIIALGATSLAFCLLAAVQTKNGLVKFVAFVSGFALGGATTFAASVPPEDFGWLIVVSVSIAAFWALLAVAVAGEEFGAWVKKGIERVGREDEDGKAAEARAVLERAAIRVLTPLLLIAAVIVAILIAANIKTVPSLAFGNHVVFAGLLLLLFFYGTLLVLLPLVRGLISGEWPVELTTSGPRFRERNKEGLKVVGKEVANLQMELEESIENSTDAALIALASLETLEKLRRRVEVLEKAKS